MAKIVLLSERKAKKDVPQLENVSGSRMSIMP
jgi:hypothetical protein